MTAVCLQHIFWKENSEEVKSGNTNGNKETHICRMHLLKKYFQDRG